MALTNTSSLNCACRSKPIIPTGAFFFPVETFEQTRHFAFLLLPEFTLLAFSSALDPLRIANQLAQKPLYRWEVLSEDGGSVRSSSGTIIDADRQLCELHRDDHLLVCSGNRGGVAASQRTLAALRRHSRFGGKTGGVCTGAITLARAGLLNDRAFTLHWENQSAFVEAFPELVPTTLCFEADGGILTCGGGAAATEMMLSVIAQDFGDDFAIAVSDMCLRGAGLETRSEQRSSVATAIGVRNPRLVQIVREMHNNIEEPLQLEVMAKNAGYSRRQIERQFRKVLGETPMSFYRNLRLDRARSLFAETDMQVAEVAISCGFAPGSGFSKHYSARFGATPSTFRIRDTCQTKFPD